MKQQISIHRVFKVECAVRVYLSLIGKAIRADDAFIVLDRGLRVARFVLVPEVHVEEPKPLRVSFIPLKIVKERPGCVALHIYPILDCYNKEQGRKQTKNKKVMWSLNMKNKLSDTNINPAVKGFFRILVTLSLCCCSTFEHFIDVVFEVLHSPVITEVSAEHFL